MNKILLINPKFSGFYENIEQGTESVPIGILYIGSFMVERGYRLKIIDCLTDSNYLNKIKKNINSTDYVGLSVMTAQIPNAIKISRFIKKQAPDIPIIWGGVHPTLLPEQTCQDPLIDYVVRGEGELTLLDLIDTLQNGKDLREVDGITYHDGDKIISNKPRAFIDMNKLPPINWDLLDKNALKRLKLIPAHTSRGCPHRCAFCINSVTKNYWRAMNAEKVLNELELIKECFSSKKIRFWDENFFPNKKRVKEIIEGMIEMDLDIQWETTIRADYFKPNYVNDEFLSQLIKSGCYKLAFGAESGSQRILDILKKDITINDLINSATQCAKYDIISEYSFMIGLPGETYSDIMKTISLIERLIKLNKKTEILGPQPFRPYPGSSLYNECVLSGWRVPTSLREWSIVMENEWDYLSPENFPWISDPIFIESIWPYIRFGTDSIIAGLNSSINTNKFFKLLFILAAKLRWEFKYFKHPIEYKIAKHIMGKKMDLS